MEVEMDVLRSSRISRSDYIRIEKIRRIPIVHNMVDDVNLKKFGVVWSCSTDDGA